MTMIARTLAVAALALLTTAPALAASCQKEANFDAWLQGVKKEALADGVPASAVNAGLSIAKFDQGIVNKDRAQQVFAQTFLDFSSRMVESYRVKQGPAKIAANKAIFGKIQQQFGVPPQVITAFWGLETDFGANMGDGPTLTSLATLAYDCRRPDLFRPQLIDALKIIARGDLAPAQMRGPWAGEMGQFQFLASHYYDYGVDEDGDGKINLIKSTPDALASAANMLKAFGWQAGQPWLQEVRVPQELPWEKADLAIQLPRSEWVKYGVKAAWGKPLPADGVKASLLLPQGRKGPAFLAYQNFQVFLQWNSSLTYSTTAAYYATRMAGAPRVTPGNPDPALSLAEGKRLQTILAKKGYDVGKIDGIYGLKSRAAVKAVQLKLGLPADSYPTQELLAKLGG